MTAITPYELIKSIKEEKISMAIDNLDKAREVNTNNVIAYWDKALNYIKLNEFKLALENLAIILKHKDITKVIEHQVLTEFFKIMYKFVKRLLNTGRLEDAKLVYEEYADFIDSNNLNEKQSINFIKLKYLLLLRTGFSDIAFDYLVTQTKLSDQRLNDFIFTQLLSHGYYKLGLQLLKQNKIKTNIKKYEQILVNVSPFENKNIEIYYNSLNGLKEELSERTDKAETAKLNLFSYYDNLIKFSLNHDYTNLDFLTKFIFVTTPSISKEDLTKSLNKLTEASLSLKKIIKEKLEPSIQENQFIKALKITNNTKIAQCMLALIFLAFYKNKQKVSINTQNNKTIPKLFIHYWDKKDIPADVKRCIESWQKHHPEFDSITFNKQSALEFIDEYYNEKTKKYFLAASHPAMEADIFRLLYLFKKGGIYVDADDMCFKRISKLTQNRANLLLVETVGVSYHVFINGLIASCANHPVIENAINQILCQPIDEVKKLETIAWNCGPGNLTLAFARYLITEPNPNYQITSFSEMRNHYFSPQLKYKDTDDWWLKQNKNNIKT